MTTPFTETVLLEALRRSEARYGPWKIEHVQHPMARARLLEDLLNDHDVNVVIAASQLDWEEQTLPIWIPVDMGLSGLRIGLIRQGAQARFSKVNSLDDLSQLRLGVGLGWSSRKVMEANGLQLEFAANQEALVRMLLAQRLDYFPRSISEAFIEHADFSRQYPELAIESGLLLDMPLPTYIFVSPKYPKLAERITLGMEKLVRDGSLQKMVIRAHEDILAKAKLCGRKMIHIPNPLLSSLHPLKRSELWFDPYAPGGLCQATFPAGREKKRK
ncbi:transporter substrate-binding domain-containing protein [Uliginosibacterium flavum]